MQIVNRWASHFDSATWAWYVWQVNVGVKTMMGNNGGPHAKLAAAIPWIEREPEPSGVFVYERAHMDAIDKFLAAASVHYKSCLAKDPKWKPDHDDRVQALSQLALNPRVGDVLPVGTPVVEPGALGSQARYKLEQQQGGVKTMRVADKGVDVSFQSACPMQIGCGNFQITMHKTSKKVVAPSVVRSP